MVQLAWWDTLLRISVAAVCGGLIGIERGRKHRPAGFRTHMIVCMGAALTMVLSSYLCVMLTSVWTVDPNVGKTDMSRFGAQVINGIGFLGAGTIIVTGRQQIKGMTTAAGLWASACMGLAIGAGFYAAAICGCTFILLTIIIFSKLERLIMSHSRNLNIYVEFEHTDDVIMIISRLKEMNVRIFDVEIEKARHSDTGVSNAIFSLMLPKKTPHTAIFTAVSVIDGIRTVQEI
jgi:putative Mg2+ transporter-C (MgtC) family protein